MSRIEILNKLKEIFSMVTGAEEDTIVLSEDSRLIEDTGLNSVGILYLVVGIEEMLGIRFENVGIADFKTIREVVDYIEGCLA